MKKREFIVREEIMLLEFLMQQYEGVSKTRIKEMLAKEVWVDGRKTTQFNYVLKPGAVVSVEKLGYKERYKPRDLEILYEDEYLVVINKASGLLSNSKNAMDKTAISELNRYFAYTKQRCNAHIVHRLDRDTSGLMVVSKTKEVSRRFESDWKEYVNDRAYVAVVWGKMEKKRDTITTWLTDGEYCVLSSPVDNGGKIAITHYEVKQSNGRYSLLELRLDTGRRNQIRVQMRELGNPVVKDPMYGYKEDDAPIKRLALHAFKLCFTHPITGKKMEFATEYPAEFEQLMGNFAYKPYRRGNK